MAEDERRVLWRSRIQAWRASSLSKCAFAKLHGVPSWQVSYWTAQFPESGQSAAATLIPVRVKCVAVDSTPVEPMLTLHSPGGWKLTIAPQIPAAWLGSLLQSLP